MDETDAIIGASGFDVRLNDDGTTTVVDRRDWVNGMPGALE